MRKSTLSSAAILLLPCLIFASTPDTLKAREYLEEALVFQKDYQAKKAIPLLEKALPIYLKSPGEISEEVAEIYFNLGNCHLDLADYEKALKLLRKSLNIRLQMPDSSAVKIGDIYVLIGLYYDYQAMYDQALQYYEKALKIYKTKLPHDHPRIGSVYNNIGICVYLKGDIQQALLYFEKNFAITIEHFGSRFYTAAQHLNNLGICNSELKNYAAATENFAEAMAVASHKETLYSLQGARLFHGSGLSFFQLKQYPKALEYLNEALEIRLREVGADHAEVATNYYAIGLCHLEMQHWKNAEDCFDKALAINLKTLGKHHPETGMCYRQKAKIMMEREQLATALSSIHLALSAFQYDEQAAPGNDALPNFQLLEVLASKAKIHHLLFNETCDLAQLSIANETYETLLKLINKFRLSYHEERSKEYLADKYFDVFDEAIEVSFQLFENTDDVDFLHKTFAISENSSSLVLLEALRHSKARSFAGIPDSLLEKEQELQKAIAFFEEQKLEESAEKHTAKLAEINSEIFDLKQKYYKLIRLFETTYPGYFRLKYNLKSTSVADIQRKILKSDQAFVEYFLGEKFVFVFIIKKDNFSVKKIKKDFPLEEWIASLRSQIMRFQFPFNLPGDYHSELVNTSHQLYMRLIKPIEKELPKRLIIIPGDKLASIPFETLITKINGEARDYKNHDYLLKNHSIGYCYSATLFQEMFEKDTRETAENMLAVAPDFGNDGKYVALRTMNLAALKYNIPEAKKVAKLLGGVLLLGDRATEQNFSEEAHKYNMIHLATHGKADGEIGENSRLGFTEIIDTIENEWLFVKDIYNIKLNAALVTLSACETGVGELRKGEGVISLARSFAYAGASCINTTLWKVNDEKTADLMTLFYKNIKTGKTKDEALRQAKLDFIQTNNTLDAHPFYWASFIMIGDMTAIDPAFLKTSNAWIWAVGLGLLGLLGFVLYFRKRSFLLKG